MLKPTTPLRPLIQASMKPSSPPPAPEQHPLKPTTPLRPKNAPKTPGSHPQRRWQFQPTHLAGPQRRHRFQTTAPRAATCPLLRKLARNSIGPAPQQHSETLKYQRKQFNFRNSLRGITCDINDLACGAWPGFETTHRSATQHRRCGGCRRVRRAWLRCPWAVAGPGRASRRRAERSSRRGRLAGTPPPTGASSSPAPSTHTKTPTRNRVGVSEPPVGIEPTTYSLRVNRSAD